MRAWLIRAPWWQLGLLQGSFLGVAMALTTRYRQGGSWTEAVVLGLISGVILGAVMGPVMARIHQRYRAEVGEDQVDRLTRIGWFGWRRKIADDPELRAAAHRVTLMQRDQLLRQRPWGISFFMLVIALDVWLSFSDSPWWLLAGAFFAAMLVMHLLMPGRLARRAEELSDPAHGGS